MIIDRKRKLFHKIALLFSILFFLTGGGNLSFDNDDDFNEYYGIPPAKLRKLYETKAVIIKDDGTIIWVNGQKDLIKK